GTSAWTRGAGRPRSCRRCRPARGPPAGRPGRPLLLLDDGLLDEAAELIAEADALGIADLDHVERDELLGGIDPEEGPGIASHSVPAPRRGDPREAGVAADLEAEAEAEPGRGHGNRPEVVSRHERHRLLPEEPRAVVLPPVQQHQAEAQVVLGRSDQA